LLDRNAKRHAPVMPCRAATSRWDGKRATLPLPESRFKRSECLIPPLILHEITDIALLRLRIEVPEFCLQRV
jgi:hypothetical protein